MDKAIPLTKEQLALADICKAKAAEFISHPELVGSESVIAAARSLIERAAAAGLPTVAYANLQVVVSTHEAEMSLREDLRTIKKLP